MTNLKYQLVPYTDPVLRQKLLPFDFNGEIDPSEIARDLAEHMLAFKGIGLSANQLGLPYRAFAIKSDPIIVCFNPRVVDQSEETILLEEGCLSFPGIFLKIKRPEVIKVRYQQPDGKTMTKKFGGITARIFLHELDHLDGICLVDHACRTKLQLAIKKSKTQYNKEYALGSLFINS